MLISPYFGTGGELGVVQEIVRDVCNSREIDLSRVTVVDDYAGRYYKNASYILSHGSSDATQAMMLNDRIIVLGFPKEEGGASKSDNMSWVDWKVQDFVELEDAMLKGKFLEFRKTIQYKELNALFDGKCTERIVDFVIRTQKQRAKRKWTNYLLDQIDRITSRLQQPSSRA
jgi:hypothetical protein